MGPAEEDQVVPPLPGMAENNNGRRRPKIDNRWLFIIFLVSYIIFVTVLTLTITKYEIHIYPMCGKNSKFPCFKMLYNLTGNFRVSCKWISGTVYDCLASGHDGRVRRFQTDCMVDTCLMKIIKQILEK